MVKTDTCCPLLKQRTKIPKQIVPYPFTWEDVELIRRISEVLRMLGWGEGENSEGGELTASPITKYWTPQSASISESPSRSRKLTPYCNL